MLRHLLTDSVGRTQGPCCWPSMTSRPGNPLHRTEGSYFFLHRHCGSGSGNSSSAVTLTPPDLTPVINQETFPAREERGLQVQCMAPGHAAGAWRPLVISGLLAPKLVPSTAPKGNVKIPNILSKGESRPQITDQRWTAGGLSGPHSSSPSAYMEPGPGQCQANTLSPSILGPQSHATLNVT